MIYLLPPKRAIVTTTKKEQIVKDQFIKSTKKDLVLFTGVMTGECIEATLKSYKSCFGDYKHEVIYLKVEYEDEI